MEPLDFFNAAVAIPVTLIINLEEMILVCLPNQWNFARELRSSPVISSNASISYLEKKDRVGVGMLIES